jgi:uncharacterized protein with ParB-like and HNH nuclease domain
MNANAVALLAIFEKKMQLEVPLFQRQYVWSKDQQWQPLWEDISRKFTEYLEGRKDAPVHFLGAMVLDQKQTPTTHVEKRQVIDGQQRLTTLQIFLAAFRDFCAEQDCGDLAKECESFTLNKGMMANSELDRFKVSPTQLDRPQFSDVMTSGSRAALEERHPLTKKKYSRKYLPRPRMVEAYCFFHDQISEFFIGTEGEPPFKGDLPLPIRIEECFQALKGALQVVAIDLTQDDDAQIIFETLNARGEPLLPADLLRNFIFLRAARAGESQEELYEKYWRGFDDNFWRVEVKQGRLFRPRSDLFMQHFLASRQTVDIPIKHLYVEYKFWIDRHRPYATVRDELAALAQQREDFRRIIEPAKTDILYGLAVFLDRFDIRTAYPLLLYLLDCKITDDQWIEVSAILEAYLVRRAICGLTTKNYNRVFLVLARTLRRDGPTPQNLRRSLSLQIGDSVEWPNDEEFAKAWQTNGAYQNLLKPKIVHVFLRLNDSFWTTKSERIAIDSALSVEHILPRNWIEHWPLPDGEKGLSWQELLTADTKDPRVQATRRRESLLHTLGNLTILTQELNSSNSNLPWPQKKPKLLEASLLPINQQLHAQQVWDESMIEQRGKTLFDRASKIWPGPKLD